MDAIEKKIKGFLGAAFGTTLVMILLGLIFVMFPGLMLSLMQITISLVLIAIGIIMISRDMQSGRVFSLFSTSLLGIFLVIMGIIIAIYPQTLNVVTIAFGVYMILNSVMQLNIANNIKGTKAYNVALTTNIIGLLCGVIMIIHPGDTNEAIVIIAGIVLIIYGVSGFIDTFILRNKINAAKESVKNSNANTKKDTKKMIENATEAEVVDKKEEK